MLCGPAAPLPFPELTGQSSAEWGRGGRERPPHSQLGDTFPPHLHSSLSMSTTIKVHLEGRISRKWAGFLWSTQLTRCGRDFTGAKAQMGPHLFFSNLFLHGVVILVGQLVTQLRREWWEHRFNKGSGKELDCTLMNSEDFVSDVWSDFTE